MTTYGRYLSCAKCDNPILKEKDGFTSNQGRVCCQACGLQEILTPAEWYAIFMIQQGTNVIQIRKNCSSLRLHPPTNPEISMVEFTSPTGTKYCIVR